MATLTTFGWNMSKLIHKSMQILQKLPYVIDDLVFLHKSTGTCNFCILMLPYCGKFTLLTAEDWTKNP